MNIKMFKNIIYVYILLSIYTLICGITIIIIHIQPTLHLKHIIVFSGSPDSVFTFCVYIYIYIEIYMEKEIGSGGVIYNRPKGNK